MDKDKNIAITFQNLVQFYSMKNGIDALIHKGYTVHIYIPFCNDSSGFGDMFDATYHYLTNLGYTLFQTVKDDINYKLLLEPYPMDWYIKINSKYRLKYKYSLLSAKPNLVYKPENNICYDAILCYGLYEANILKNFSNVELIGNLKYINLKKLDKPSTQKKILLYLPTYGNVSSIDSITDQLLKLKNQYYIITKLHHGTSFLQEEKNRINKLKNISDEYYDHRIELAQLLSKVDIVLSDNSGSIFEALYAQKPLAIYSEDINSNKIGNFNTIQYQLVHQGYIPYTNNLENIDFILEQALSAETINKQMEIRNKLFYFPENPIKEFVQIIEKYLNDNVDNNYKALHDVLIENYQNYIEENKHLKSLVSSTDSKILDLSSTISNIEQKIQKQNLTIEKYQKEIQTKDLIIHYYENGKLYKLSKKIYQSYYKLKNKE